HDFPDVVGMYPTTAYGHEQRLWQPWNAQGARQVQDGAIGRPDQHRRIPAPRILVDHPLRQAFGLQLSQAVGRKSFTPGAQPVQALSEPPGQLVDQGEQMPRALDESETGKVSTVQVERRRLEHAGGRIEPRDPWGGRHASLCLDRALQSLPE